MADYKVSKRELSRELPGAILGLILFGVFVGISWFLGEVSIISLGWGGIVLGLMIGGFFGYLYAVANRRRRFDAVMGIMVIGYVIGAYLLEPVFPAGQFLVNLATSNAGTAFILWIAIAAFLLALLLAPFVYAKRTDLR